ncbi:unnamed protein product [Lepidochelys olivacea]
MAPSPLLSPPQTISTALHGFGFLSQKIHANCSQCTAAFEGGRTVASAATQRPTAGRSPGDIGIPLSRGLHSSREAWLWAGDTSACRGEGGQTAAPHP